LFEPKIQDFLNKKKSGTKKIYTAGLVAFQEFYAPQGSLPDFLDRLQTDRSLDWRQTQKVAANVMTDYVKFLMEKKKFKRKTVRAYAGAVQQLARYYNLGFTTRDIGLPFSNPDLKKHSWNVEEMAQFLGSFDASMYRSFGVSLFQSSFDCSTTLDLEFRDIQVEYEQGIVPLCLDTERIKTGVPFYGFIGEWGVKELHNWLDSRVDLKPEDKLYPVSEQSIMAYFRKKAEAFSGCKFGKGERTDRGTHSFRGSSMTLPRNNLKGSMEKVKAAEVYIQFFAGKTVPEKDRSYLSNTKEDWREIWKTTVEPYVTPKKF
jgi:hypothetical protein